jgi:hypothetical protein
MNTDECTCKMWLWYLCYRSQINSRNLKFPGEDIKKKKGYSKFLSLSQWPNWQFPQSVIRLYNVWILTLFTSYLSEFLHQNHLSSWPNTSDSVSESQNRHVYVVVLRHPFHLLLINAWFLDFESFYIWDLTNLPVHPFRALSSLLSISLCLIYSMRDLATIDVLLHFSFQS